MSETPQNNDWNKRSDDSDDWAKELGLLDNELETAGAGEDTKEFDPGFGDIHAAIAQTLSPEAKASIAKDGQLSDEVIASIESANPLTEEEEKAIMLAEAERMVANGEARSVENAMTLLGFAEFLEEQSARVEKKIENSGMTPMDYLRRLFKDTK